MMLAICVFLLFISPVPAPPTDGQTRVLSESFSSPTLNTTLWNYGYPWGSYYTHRANTTPRQVRVTADGLLNITATRERSINQGIWTEYGPIDLDFSSGAVNTDGKFCIKNGYVEISVRVPETQSTWPTVFLVPDNQGQVPMLTVMEVFDARTRYSYGFKYTNDQGSVEEMSAIAQNRPTSDAVHRYGVDWGYDQITWYYDDKWVNTITKSNELKQVNNMCLVIGLGVGGKSKETPVDPRAYPSIMSVNLLEIWQPKYDGFYKFQNVQTGLLLEIDSASHDSGAKVLQWYDNGGDWQKWQVQYAGHGQYRLIVAHSRLALDAEDWGLQDGTKLLQYWYHSGDNQLWKIQEVPGAPDVVQLINVFALTNSIEGQWVTVPAATVEAGAQLQLWRNLNSDLQNWRMIRL